MRSYNISGFDPYDLFGVCNLAVFLTSGFVQGYHLVGSRPLLVRLVSGIKFGGIHP
jgi:hypothetical protein